MEISLRNYKTKLQYESDERNKDRIIKICGDFMINNFSPPEMT